MFARPLEAPIYHPVLKHSRFAAKLRAEVTPRPAWETSCARSARHLKRNKSLRGPGRLARASFCKDELLKKLGHGVDEFLDLEGWLERIVQKDRHLSPAQERHAHKGRVHP